MRPHSTPRLFACCALLVGLLLAALAPARAETGTGPWFDTDHGSVRLIAATDAVGDRDRLKLGLEFQLKDSWKIYWRSPGDAGFPPRPDWHGAENVAATEIAWPAPERFSIFDLQTFGYGGEVVLPLTLTPRQPGEPVRLAGTVSYLTCSDICVPYDADLSIELPAGAARGTPAAHLIDKYRAAVPMKQRGPATATPGGLGIERVAVRPSDDGDHAEIEAGAKAGVTLAVSAVSASAFDDGPMELLVEGPAGSWFGRATATVDADRRTARFTLDGGGASVEALTDAPLTLTLIDGARAVEASLTPTLDGDLAASSGALVPAIENAVRPGLADAGTGGTAPLGLWTVLGLALLGGLILNLMPCVLPVLSLKLMGVVSMSGSDLAQVRLGFLASSAGILVSFLALAGAAIGVKAAGYSVGWGIQFQQPVFLAFMVALLVLFTCNLLGLFEFRLPGAVGDRAAGASAKGGYLGDFLTGAFATLLATPCSAPFLGTAVGFALSRGAGEILAVFAALGVGLALPYLAVAAVPRAARLLPRPGPWMVWLKRVLALALIGTAVWLIDILRVSLGGEAAAAVGMLAGLAGIVLGAKKVQDSRMARFAWPLSAMLAVLTVIYPLTVEYRTTGAASARTGASDGAAAVEWIPFDQAVIAEHVAAGRTVFVDVTADWCVTCQWNKKTVMQAGAVADWLAAPEVVAMRADWTRPDPAIGAYLAEFGRYGIPFNAVYGPDAPTGIALPELLRESDVVEAAMAAGSRAALARR